MSQHQQNQQKLNNLVQFMLANGCVTACEMDQFLAKIEVENGVEQWIPAINNNILNKFHMRIRQCMDEITTEKHFVLISTVDNNITRAAHDYTPKQYDFFKSMMNLIVENPVGVISMESLKELASQKSMTAKGEYKTIFNDLCKKKWLTIVNGDNITLGVRSLAELDVLLKQTPTDLNCNNCKILSIYSSLCATCGARFHKRCAKLCLDEDTRLCKSCINQERTPEVSTSDRKTRRSSRLN